MKKVFLCGEGTDDIGGWANSPTWRADDRGHVEPGVAEALLTAKRREGWQIVGGERWKNLRGGFAAGSVRRGRHRDRINVLIGVLRAAELGADVLVLMRDSDGDLGRADAVRDGMRDANADLGFSVAGGPAEPCLEGWMLAVSGEHNSEALGKSAAQTRCAAIADTRAAMVSLIETRGLADIPADARSLLAWLASTDAALASG